MKKPKGILFDCDGCLLDSEKIYLDTVKEYLLEFGIQSDYEDLVFILGKPMPIIAQDLIQKYHLNTTSEKLIYAQRKRFKEYFKNAKLEPMPYLKDFLVKIKKENILTAIASSSLKDYVEDVVRRLDITDYFDEITTGEEVKNGKPSPDIYLLAAKKLGLKTEDLIVIEDSSNGIKAGINAHIFTIGYKGSVILQDTSEANISVSSYQEIQWDEQKG